MTSIKKLLSIIIIFVVLGLIAYLYYREGMLPVNKTDKSTKVFVIKNGEGLNSIVKNLHNEGLIRNTVVFFVMVKRDGLDKKIQAGDFRLSPSMYAKNIGETLTHGTLDEWVTVVEGLRKEEVAQVIAKKLEIPEIEFTKLAPEGYLFPDTYLIPRQATAEAIITLFTSTFKRKFTPEMRAQIKQLGLSEHEAVTLASLVEREARTDQVRQQVAGILLHRLKEGMPLQVDATVQYALGYQSQEKSWWKKELTHDDLLVKSAYNTYKNPGFPPEPICNPSLSSLQAVTNADPSTPYFFYITDKNGVMHYAKTAEEHNRNIEKYLN